ncbi:MAG: carboxylesterase/lipase family protein [Deltaproteobacteria bacterium]|nr:carboxylesterase/lipase family protein [Deltaproteobacteria bacterium]
MEKESVVETSNGKVRGYNRRGIIKFKGIPYAAPPVGSLRFSSPVPLTPWTGVRDALEYSPIASQAPSNLELMFGGQRVQSEAECLTLNIWTPGIDSSKRPVLFFIHGGAFVTGTGASLDGSRLALRGDVVVVSINYRLGVLGFLYLPDESEASSNVGLLDMASALSFVKENIARFGGDPDQVAIFGESAGGFAVAALLAMPSAKGLFHRAILQSGVAHPLGMNPEAAVRVHEKLIKHLGIPKGDLKALRRISVEEIIKAQTAIMPVSGGFTEDRPLRLGPVVDHQVLPEHPLAAIRKGYAREIAVFAGSNLDETKLWTLLNPESEKIEIGDLERGAKAIVTMAGKNDRWRERLLEIYRRNKKTPRDIMDAITTDYTFRIPSIRLAEAQSLHQKNTFMYLFTWPSPFKGGKYGAMHALELGFVFGVLLAVEVGIFPKKDTETEILSEAMMDTWIAFARTGNPNNPALPALPPYSAEKRATVIFDKEIKVQDDPYGEERTAWEGLM